jgi:broad specificity phosphatase PhoE
MVLKYKKLINKMYHYVEKKKVNDGFIKKILYLYIMKEIYIVRHGQTHHNTLKIKQGAEINSELNKKGLEQAKLTGKYLKKYRINDKNFDCILTTPLKRGIKTAEIIAKEINFDKDIIIFEELNDKFRGKISGLKKNSKEIKKINEAIERLKKKIGDPLYFFYEFDLNKYLEKKFNIGAEPIENLVNRIKKIINFIENTKCKKMLMITHGEMVMNILKYIFNINYHPLSFYGNYKYGNNCWITYIQYNRGKYKLINPPDSEHLTLDL